MLFSTDTRNQQLASDDLAAAFSPDNSRLHIRQTIDLDQELAEDLKDRKGTEPLVLIADRVLLSGAKIADRDLVIVARTVEAGVSGVPLKLYRSGAATPAVVTQTGTVSPNVPTQGSDPGTGLHGPTLIVVCKALFNGAFAESRGQQGGKGLKGARETRNICTINPGPCEGATPDDLATMEGSPGGKGGKGGPGGPGGKISVFVVQDFAANAPLWRGVGGPGGEGGEGGKGGEGGNQLADEGGLGPTGDPGDVPAAIPGSVKVIGEDEFYQRVKDIGTPALEVLFPAPPPVQTQKAAGPWATFKRLEAARDIRTGFTDGNAAASLDEAARLAPETEESLALRRVLRYYSTASGIENDLDPIVTPATLESEMSPVRESMLAVVLPLLPAAKGKLLEDPRRLEAMKALRDELASLTKPGGEFTNQRIASNDRAQLAWNTRSDAQTARATVATRLQKRLKDAGSNLSVVFPDAQVTLTGEALENLRQVLFALAPALLPVDTVDDPLPSGDQATLLPTSVGLLVHSSVRDAGPHGKYPPDGPGSPSVFGLAARADWSKALQAGTGHAIDLTRVVNELRSGFRTATGTPLTDPTVVAVVSDFVELAETVHLWRLGDLRIEQAIQSLALIAPAEEEAGKANAALQSAVANDNPRMSVFIRGLRVLGDLLSWRVHRAQRAHDLFTLDLRRFDVDPLSYEQFDPGNVADLSAKAGELETEAASAARAVTEGLGRVATTGIMTSVNAYDNERGTRVTDFLARRTFCLQPGGTDCAVAPHVFEGLNDPLQEGFWFDADLSDVQGPHCEAKISGVRVYFEYDLAGADVQLPDLIPVRLVHQGMSRQRQFDADVVHRQRTLPQVVEFDLKRLEENGYAWESDATVLGPPGFPATSRGVAAGYRLELRNQLAAAPHLLRKVEVQLQYNGRQAGTHVNLQSAALSSGLREGAIASGTIELTGAAPVGGTKVRLRSSDPATLKVPAEITVPAGQSSAAFAVEVVKPTGVIPPKLTASTLDGVNRHARVIVPKAAAPLKKTVAVGGEGGAFAVAVGRPVSATGPRSEPTIYVAHAPHVTEDNPPGDGPDNSVHAFRADFTELTSRQIGFWPRSIDVDAGRGRVYVVHGPTVSLLDAKTLATKAERLIGVNAMNVAVDTSAELVYVTRYSHGLLHVLRGADLTPVEVFGTLETLRGCNGVAIDPARSLIYVARNFRIAEPTATAVTRIRRRPDGTHVIERDITVGPTLLQPQSIAVDAAAGMVFVGCLGGGDVHPELLVLDAGTLAVQHRVGLPRGAQWVASREGTGIAYVVTSEGLHLVDGRNGRMGITIKTGPHPQGVAVDRVSGVAYVGDRLDHSLTRVETPASVTATAWR